MKRICIIGSSQVAAVKKAADTMKSKGELEGATVTIFGSHRSSLHMTRAAKGTIRSEQELVQENFRWTSGGQTEVVISDYDEICFIIGRSIHDMTLYKTGSDIPIISDALADRLLANIISRWPFRLAKATAKANRKVQVTHVGVPFVSAEAPMAKALLANYHDPESTLPERLAKLRAMIATKTEALSEENFQFMKPLSSALDDSGLFTQHVYCEGSPRLAASEDVAHPHNDYEHMNPAYGRLVLERLLS